MSRNCVLAVVIAAFVIRLGFLLWSHTTWNVEPRNTLLEVYYEQGKGIAAGDGYRRHLGLYDSVPETFHPPGLPILIAALDVVSLDPRVPLELFCAILDSLAAGVATWLAAYTFGSRTGVATGICYATYPPLAYWAGSACGPEAFQSFFVLATAACALKGAESVRRRAVFWFGAAGVFAGLNCYFRPDYLFLPVVLGVGLGAATRLPWRSVRGMLAAQIVAFAVLLPWAWRNQYVSGQWYFTSSGVGAALITGLGEFTNPWGFGSTDDDRSREAQAHGFRSWHVPDADAYFRSLFWQAIKERPGAYGISIIKRAPLAVAAPQSFGYRNPNKTTTFTEARAGGMDRYDVLTQHPFYVLRAYWDVLLMAGISFFAFACSLVMLAKERHRWGVVIFLLCPYMYSVGTHVLTHMEPRFILPSMWCVLIACAYVISRGWRRSDEAATSHRVTYPPGQKRGALRGGRGLSADLESAFRPSR